MAIQGSGSFEIGHGGTTYPEENTPLLENANGVKEPVDDTSGAGFVWSGELAARLMPNWESAPFGLTLFAKGGHAEQIGNAMDYSYAGTITDGSILTTKEGSIEDCPDYSCVEASSFDRWYLDVGARLYTGWGRDDNGFHYFTLEPGISFQNAWVAGDNYAPVMVDGNPLPGALRQTSYKQWTVAPDLVVAGRILSTKSAALYLRGELTGNPWGRSVTLRTRDRATNETVSQVDWAAMVGLELRAGQGALPREAPPPPPPEPPPPPPPEPPPPPVVEDTVDDAPLPLRFVIIKRGEFVIKEKVHFDFNKASINPVSFPLIRELANAMNSSEGIHATQIEIQGNTDPIGGKDSNMRLSQARAESVRNKLIEYGVDENRLTARGYGESKPVDPITGTDYSNLISSDTGEVGETLLKAKMGLTGKPQDQIKEAYEVFRRVGFIVTERDDD